MELQNLLLLLTVGFFAGIVGGSLGVGGGIVIVPSLVFLMGFSQHQAQGTSLAVLLFPVGILGAYNYYRQGYVNMKFALILALAFLAGSYLGSYVAVHLPEKIVRKMFALIMFVVSFKLFFTK